MCIRDSKQIDGKWKAVQAEPTEFIQIDGKWREVPAGSVTYIQVDGNWRAVPANSVTYKQIDGQWRAVPNGSVSLGVTQAQAPEAPAAKPERPVKHRPADVTKSVPRSP